MKAPIGLALIFLGITVGYLVLAGKLPNPNVTASNPSGAVVTNAVNSAASGAASATQGTGGGPYLASQVRYV